jgi:3-isopropylmalate dehydratase small subunit
MGRAWKFGENFGMGSSREHAPAIIKIACAKAVLAKSLPGFSTGTA